MLAELGRIFLELDLALDFLLVLARVIDLAGLLIPEHYECVLGHRFELGRYYNLTCPSKQAGCGPERYGLEFDT